MGASKAQQKAESRKHFNMTLIYMINVFKDTLGFDVPVAAATMANGKK